MSTIEKAKAIAKIAHEGQLYDGKDYFETHVSDVAARVAADPRSTDEAVMAAWLHDVVEDSEVTFEDIHDAGFTFPVVVAVIILTKPEGMSYEVYMNELRISSIATLVKFHDSSANYEYGGRPKYAKNLEFLKPHLVEHFGDL